MSHRHATSATRPNGWPALQAQIERKVRPGSVQFEQSASPRELARVVAWIAVESSAIVRSVFPSTESSPVLLQPTASSATLFDYTMQCREEEVRTEKTVYISAIFTSSQLCRGIVSATPPASVIVRATTGALAVAGGLPSSEKGPVLGRQKGDEGTPASRFI